jgi:hypothetical protein
VQSHPEGTVFHHSAWMRVLTYSSTRQPICLACVDEVGAIHGVLPLLKTPGFWCNLGPQTLKRRISSLPRTPVTGPLALDPGSANLLVQAAIDLSRRPPRSLLELKLGTIETATMVTAYNIVPWEEHYVLTLPDTPEELRFGNSVTRHRIKSAVKKAVSHGIEVRQAESEEDLRGWYQLYLDTMRWHGAIARPYHLFAAMWQFLRPKGLFRLVLAEQSRNGARKLLSGYILLMGGRTIHCYVNGRQKEDLGLHPNDIILWHVIHDACKEGFRKIDFLEVQGQHGLADFKSKWGAKPVPSYRFYLPAYERRHGSAVGIPSYRQRLMTAVWRRLPLRATASIAGWIHQYL